MHKSLTLLAPWMSQLSISVLDGGNAPKNLDFNRFRYIGVPPTKEILNNKVQSANRDDLAIRLFDVITGREDAETATKSTMFAVTRQHFIFCDQNKLSPFTQEACLSHLEHNQNRQRLGLVKDSTVNSFRSSLTSVFIGLNLPIQEWLLQLAPSSKTQSEPVRGYSDNDLKKMLPLLRGLFKQLYKQFISDHIKHLEASPSEYSMSFEWQGVIYKIQAGVNKLFCAAGYLLSYYTWCNSSVLYHLKRPQKVKYALSEQWYQMPAFKRRAFKTFTVEIGDHGRLEVPKYALQFMDQLIQASQLVDSSPDGYLLNSWRNGHSRMLNSTNFRDFKSSWLIKHFPMFDDRGERLWPVVSRFRATGGLLTLARQGAIEASILLNNTPNVVKVSYSSGNRFENDLMNRDTSQALELSARDRQGVDHAKEKLRKTLKVEVLAYESYLDRALPMSRNANECADNRVDVYGPQLSH